MLECSRHSSTHLFVATLLTSALAAGCNSNPHLNPGRFHPDDPYPEPVYLGEESALRAAGSCELSFTAPPSIMPGGRAEEADCPCTRRLPEQGDATACVAGADWGVTATVGPEGGRVAISRTPSTQYSSLNLDVPPGALSEPTTIRIIETSLPPPPGFTDRSPVYVFEPVGLTFKVPVTVKIASDSQGVIPDSRFAIYWSSAGDPCALAPLADDYDNAGFNEGTITQLGWAMVGTPRTDAMAVCP